MQESLDQSVRSRDVLEATTPGVPSLARIPSFKWTPEVDHFDAAVGTRERGVPQAAGGVGVCID